MDRELKIKDKILRSLYNYLKECGYSIYSNSADRTIQAIKFDNIIVRIFEFDYIDHFIRVTYGNILTGVRIQNKISYLHLAKLNSSLEIPDVISMILGSLESEYTKVNSKLGIK